jgi:hypothetical protein
MALASSMPKRLNFGKPFIFGKDGPRNGGSGLVTGATGDAVFSRDEHSLIYNIRN